MATTEKQSTITLMEGVHVLVKNKEGLVEQNKHGNWLVLDLQTQNMFYITPTIDVLQFFKIGEWTNVSQAASTIYGNTRTIEENIKETEQENDGRNPWSKVDILKLINFYKKYETHFKSTTVKNEKVWQWISNEIKTHTAEQCKNKFKYLKSKYIEKKDNMGSRATGSKFFKFDYFEWFEEIFGCDANVEPVALASSSRGNTNIISEQLQCNVNELDKENVCLEGNPRKRKKSFLEKHLSAYEETAKERENAKEKRHKELLDRQDQALDILKKVATSFEKYVEKNT